MEEILKSLLHLGVGVVKTVEGGFKVDSTDPQGILTEVINKGETADDEVVERLRGYIDQVTSLANEYESKAKEVFESLAASLQNIDVNNIVDDLGQKFNDIVAQVRGSGNDSGGNSNSTES